MPHDATWAEPFRRELLDHAATLQRAHPTVRVDLPDVVQATLLAAAQVSPPSRLRVGQWAWLKAALLNDFRDEVRRRSAKKRSVLRERQLGSDELAAKQESPSRPLKRAEEIARLMQHVGDLPPDQQTALRLRYLDDLSVDEVAARMNRTRPAVAGLLRRGLDALRAKYGDARPSI